MRCNLFGSLHRRCNAGYRYSQGGSRKPGSSHIEAEHLLLGIARAIKPELKELLRLKEVEDGVPCGVNPWVHSEEEQSR